MTDAPNRRRQYLVDRSFQYRFIGAVLLFLIATFLGTLGAVYYALWSTLEVLELLEEILIVTLFNVVAITVTAELVILAPIAIVIALLLTHKVVGPLGRVKGALRQMSQGDFNVHLKLRRGDLIQDLADVVNELAESLRARPR